jgi:hypothetical protein
MVAVTIILVILMWISLPHIPMQWYDSEVPTVFEITNIRHTDTYGHVNFESYMVVKNIGDAAYDNRNLYAKTYRNGNLLPCFISTLNGHDFISTQHFGIQDMGGFGSHDYNWGPGAMIYIDYSQGTFRPGNVVRFEVYDRDSNQIISRDTWPHTYDNTKKWMDLLF